MSKPTVEQTCERCHQPFQALLSEVRRRGVRYCSRKCFRAKVLKFTCPTCSTPFERKDWEVRDNKAVIACSQKCAFVEMKRQCEAGHTQRGVKRCPQCEQVKPLDDFAKAARERSGRTVYCRQCQSVRSKKYKGNGNKKRAKIKAELVVRLGNKCVRCGAENLPICCYEFHHKEDSGKEFNISMYLAQRAWNIEAEIAKCELLCSYCHNIEHAPYSDKPATAYL